MDTTAMLGDAVPNIPAPNAPTPEEVPIRGVLAALEALIREPRRVMVQLGRAGAGGLVRNMFIAAAVCLLIYGVVAGTYSRGTQLWAAPVKVTGGLLFSVLICLPSLYIFACLGGVRARLVEVAGLVMGLAAILALMLVGFAPVALVFSTSTDLLPAMGGLHIVFGLVACFFGMRFLSAGFTYFRAESRAGLKFWMVLFLLVALQMTTALRPIIGTSDKFLPTEKKFFMSHWSDSVKEAVEKSEKHAKAD